MNAPSLPLGSGRRIYGIAESWQRIARTTRRSLGGIARKAQRDRGSASFALAGGVSAAAVAPRDAAHDEQSQAGAFHALAQALVDAVEAAEDPLQFALRDALALVGDPHQQIGGFVENFNGDGNLAGRVFDRVFQQIVDRRPQLFGISLHKRRGQRVVDEADVLLGKVMAGLGQRRRSRARSLQGRGAEKSLRFSAPDGRLATPAPRY